MAKRFPATAFFLNRAKAFGDSGGWLLIIVGLILFAARIPLTSKGYINLPVVATVFQTAGLMFTIAGLQIFISRLVWPSLSFVTLARKVDQEGSMAAAVLLLALFLYNGLSTLAFVIWLSSALGAGLGAT